MNQHRRFHIGAQNDALYIISGQAPATTNDYPNHEADRTCIAKVFDAELDEAKRLVHMANRGIDAGSEPMLRNGGYHESAPPAPPRYRVSEARKALADWRRIAKKIGRHGFTVEGVQDLALHVRWSGEEATVTNAHIETILEALAAPPVEAGQALTVPAGYALVPLELTEEMHAAAVRTIVRCTGNDDFPPRVWRAMLAASPQAPQRRETWELPKGWALPAALHPETSQLVSRFAHALAVKLRAAERKYGYSDGWRSADWMDECRAKLLEHVSKGDPLDVAAYCAFLWHHGESTATPAPEVAATSAEADDESLVVARARAAQLAPRCRNDWEQQAIHLAFALAENYGVTPELTARHGDALLTHLQSRDDGPRAAAEGANALRRADTAPTTPQEDEGGAMVQALARRPDADPMSFCAGWSACLVHMSREMLSTTPAAAQAAHQQDGGKA